MSLLRDTARHATHGWLNRWAILLAFFAFAALSNSTPATTWRHVKTTCPIDGTQVTGRIPGSTFIPGRTPDFRPQGVGVDFFLSSMLRCPTCGFTTSAHRFDETEGLDKQKIKTALEALDTPTLFAKHDAAILVEKNWTNNPSALARLTLGAKWLADDTGEPDLIDARLQQAITAHRVLLADPQRPEEDRAAITYLVGELLRQQGENEQALQWFDKARPNAEEGLATLIDQQAALTKQGDDPPAVDLEKARNAAPGQQLAAIRLLRERDDPETISLLKDICLNSPPEMRESTIYELVGEEPRAIHLPIFLEAIGSDHFRTVQGGAYAAQLLRATEAAPLIVKALKNPVRSTAFRLMQALAATATEREIPFLKQQIEAGEASERVLIALINTRSEQAVPLIKQCADAIGYGLIFIDDSTADLQAIKASGPKLGRELPDLRKAGDASGQTYLKLLVLSVTDDASSADELAAVIALDNDISKNAALALARRGDRRAKDYLVEHIDWVHARDSYSFELLYPLLEESDFTAMQAGLKREYDDRERRVEDLNELMALVQDEESKAVYQRQIDRLLEDTSEWYVEPWLPLLGATRNPEAIPILLHYLENENHQARAGAVRGLAFFNNDAVAEALAARLPEEAGGYVSTEIIKALGKTKNPIANDALLELVKQPTLVDTKLAWIEASAELPAEQRAPVLRYWSGSPNAELASAADAAKDVEAE